MLDFKGISVHYGHQDVLTDVTFRVNKGERVGVVGPNGSGKSTLFKIVLGEMSTDKGELVIEGSPRIGFTRQNPEPDSEGETLLEYSLRGIPGLSDMEEEMRRHNLPLWALESHDPMEDFDLIAFSPDDLTAVKGFVKTNAKNISTCYIYGGDGVIPASVETALKSALGILGAQADDAANPMLRAA